MTLNVAIALLFNVGLILIVSWGFFFYAMRQQSAAAERLTEKLRKARQKLKAISEELARERQIPEASTGDHDFDGFVRNMQRTAINLDSMAGVVQEQSSSLQTIEQASDALQEDDQSRELKVQLATLKAQFAEGEQLIAKLRTQASGNRHQLSVLEEKLERTGDQSRRIQGLEKQERNLRREIKLLQRGTEEKDSRLRRMGRMQKENTQLRGKISQYFAKNKQSEELIKELQQKLRAVQSMADETRQSLEQLQTQPPINPSDFELGELKDALERTMREKQFIEDQYLELLDKVEAADDVAEQLQRTQNECAMLEQSYLTLIEEFERADAEDLAENNPEEAFKLEEISIDE